MSRKKQRPQPPPKAKEFHATPFDALKGVAVASVDTVAPVKAPVSKKIEPVENSMNLFLQAVADVTPLHSSGKKPRQAGSQPLRITARNTAEQLVVTEENSFLEEIGRLKLDCKFSDTLPDDGELHPLSGNRLRQVQRGVVTVDHQLDLHGLTREEALEALPPFLCSARNKGQKAVLVITGKGNHSPEEPVLQQAVSSWLRDAGRAIVLEFAPAPRNLGGNGAFVVFLRGAAGVAGPGSKNCAIPSHT